MSRPRSPQVVVEAVPARPPDERAVPRSAVELLQELQLHQVELESQNETLHQATAALEASRDRYAELYEFGPLGYLTLGATGQITELNLAGARFLGGERGQLLGRRFDLLLERADRAAWRRLFPAALAGRNDRASLDVGMVRPDGALLHFQLDCLRGESQDGAPGLRVAMTDITARQQAEQTLRESEELFRSIFENSMDAVLLTEPGGGIRAANPEAQRMFGLSEETLRAGGRQSVVDTSDPRLAAALAQREKDGRFIGELTFLGRDGRRFPGEISSSLFAGKDGRAMTSMIVRDITARKEAERALERYRNHLEDLVTERAAELSRAEDEQRRLNRTLRLLRDGNATLVRATSEPQLLQDLCRLAVESGGYLMAWAGLAECDARKSVRPVAQSGYEEGYLESVKVSWDEAQDVGRGPTGTAIRTGLTQVNQNCLTNPVMAPWREAALRRGYQASLALPLVRENEVLGSLTLYAAAPQAFGPMEVALLEELAGNMAYGLQALRVRVDLERARQELEARVLERTKALAETRNRVARFAENQQRALEQERRRVSREVHDQIGQVFTSIQLIIASLAPGSVPPAHEAALVQALAMGVATTRRITAELRPPLLDDLGLVAALEHFAGDLSKRGHLACDVAMRDAEALGETYALCLFRVMQEAVNNALRHAGARRLSISGGKDGAGDYVFSIADDGRGFDPNVVHPGAIGRSAMRERAALLGGDCRILSAPGQGTVVEVRLPLSGKPD